MAEWKLRSQRSEIQGFFCPVQRPDLVAKRLRSGKCILSEAGLEKLCAKCASYWPMDTEFWFPVRSASDGLHNWCRACYVAQRWPDGRTASTCTEETEA